MRKIEFNSSNISLKVSMKNEDTGVSRLVSALGFSINGLKRAIQREAAFRQEIVLAMVLLPIAMVVGDSGLECALLVASVLLVLIVELLNTGVEAVVDRVGEEFHELAGYAKDAGSAAVLIALIQLLIVWALIIWG